TDPTLAIQILRRYPPRGSDWETVQSVAADAQSRGVARRVIPTGDPAMMAFTGDGKRLMVGGFDNAIVVWDRITGERVGEIPFAGTATDVAVAESGKQAAAVGDGGQVIIWDWATLKWREIGRHPALDRRVVFSPDGRLLASAGVAGADVWTVANDG